MPLLDTDGWWKKHAVTTVTRIVSVDAPTSGGWQKVTADVRDPETGEVATGIRASLFPGREFPAFQADSEHLVRWSAKRREFRIWSRFTAPDEEYTRSLNDPTFRASLFGQGADPGGSALAQALAQGGTVTVSGSQAAEVLTSLLGAGAAAHGTAAQSSEDPLAERLAKLDRLRDAGLLSAEEHAAQRRRILDSI